MFWHVEPRPATRTSLVNVVRVPALDLERAKWVGGGTAVAVLVGFAWVVWKLIGVYKRERGESKVEGERSEKKNQ